MDSVLVTGASGFIGSHLSARLAQMGIRVVGTCTSYSRAGRLQNLPSCFTLALADLNHPETFNSLFLKHRFSTVFHLAACGVHQGQEDARTATAVNTWGSFALGQMALTSGVRRFVHCGSALEFAPADHPLDENSPFGPFTLYGASKHAGAVLLDYLQRSEGLPLTTVRPFTVFGPAESGNKLIPYLIRNGLRGEQLNLGSGSQLRDYVYVSDVVDALLLAATRRDTVGSSFNIGSGPHAARSIHSIVETTLTMIGAPMSLCSFGTATRTRVDAPSLIANPSRARREMGWKPRVTFEFGLRKTIESYVAGRQAIAHAA
jgi:nucleoside-diphosphate-sugar epimerase